jgi:hypothetical protein
MTEHHPIPAGTSRPSASDAEACSSARRRHRASRYPVLDAVEHAFARLAADPATPRVRTTLGMLPLSVVRSILADPATPMPEADVIWRTLIGRSRADADAASWLLAAVGCALPRIRSGIWHATRDRAVERDEAAQAALAAFTEAVLTIDPVPIHGVLDELVRSARNAAQTVADRVARDRIAHRKLSASIPPPAPAGHVDFVLADLVARGVITREEADLIGRHRFEGTSLRRLAELNGVARMRVHRQLRSAEARVVAALDHGQESPAVDEKVRRKVGQTGVPDLYTG